MKINLGSGPNKKKDGWINIDLCEGADIKTDLRRGIPFKNNIVEKIYSSHFLEHLEYKEICALLLECKRVLVPGGEISLCVPDARKFINSYVNDDIIKAQMTNGIILDIPSFLAKSEEAIYGKAIVSTGSPMDWVNYIAYSNSEHKYMFDDKNLISHLQIAGFKKATLRKFSPELDNKHGQQASIFAQARKKM